MALPQRLQVLIYILQGCRGRWQLTIWKRNVDGRLQIIAGGSHIVCAVCLYGSFFYFQVTRSLFKLYHLLSLLRAWDG